MQTEKMHLTKVKIISIVVGCLGTFSHDAPKNVVKLEI